ncbi:MAG: polysaccharide export protein, partial [Desulfobacteraceae bacterium]|nr:polysaccharide export protein [Desulfobacteraceae bacterium]
MVSNRNCYIILMFVVFLLGLFPGCGGNQQTTSAIVKQYAATPAQNDETTRLNEQMFAAAKMHTDPSDYLLGAGDLLQVTVFESKSLNTTVRVSSRGHITLPLLGQVEVKGLTAREVEIKIEKHYRVKYIKDPHVSVFVEEHMSKRVTLVGQFKQPGTYEYPSRQTLLDVMALAGGLTDKAGNMIQVRRNEARPGEPNVLVIDLDQLIKKGRTDLNVDINGGDIIFAPEAGHFFVDGAVRRAGSYPIREKLEIREALLIAGGIRPWGLKDSIVLIRNVEGKGRTGIEIDLNNSDNHEIEIKDGDIIVVKTSSWGNIVHGGGVNIGVPGFGFGYRNPEW